MKLLRSVVAFAVIAGVVGAVAFAANDKYHWVGTGTKQSASPQPSGAVSPSASASPSAEDANQTGSELKLETSSTTVSDGKQQQTTQTAVIEYKCTPGESVFASLGKTGHQIGVKTTSFGKLVTSIDGREQGNNKYWLFTVDGKEATVGAEAYTCKGNENIRWELK